MNMHLAIIVSLFVVTTATGQVSVKKDIPGPFQATVFLDDGSKVNVIVLNDNLTIATKFGKQTIPFREVKWINFDLKSLAKKEKVPAELLKAQGGVIVEADFKIAGIIEGNGFRIHSSIFGNHTLKFSAILFLKSNNDQKQEIKIDASKHANPDQWLDTKVTVGPNHRLVIEAKGEVDIWPQQPGQYLVGPKGYTSAGRGGKFMAGELIAKVGLTGKPFTVGEKCECAPLEEGALYFQIVASPWNNASSGSYAVTIKTDYKVP